MIFLIMLYCEGLFLPGWKALIGLPAMSGSDLVRHQFLQPPQVAVVDAECFEVTDRVVEIFST
jgi:hypothetical protein